MEENEWKVEHWTMSYFHNGKLKNISRANKQRIYWKRIEVLTIEVFINETYKKWSSISVKQFAVQFKSQTLKVNWRDFKEFVDSLIVTMANKCTKLWVPRYYLSSCYPATAINGGFGSFSRRRVWTLWKVVDRNCRWLLERIPIAINCS